MKPTVVTNADELDKYVGKLITLRGEVSNSKVPTILGVDVSSDEPDLRGQTAQATGILQRSIVTQEEIDARIAAEGQFAHRGPGTFYSLVNEDGSGLAPVEETAN
jgi:hypothetical protein